MDNTKKICLTILLLLSFCLELQAQSKIGLQFGKCYSRFDVVEGTIEFYDFSKKYDHEGFLVKSFYAYSFNKYIGIKQYLGYEKRGAVIKRDYGWVGYDKFSLKYLNFATNIELYPVKFVCLSGGLDYDYLFKAISYVDKNRNWESTDQYNRFDIGYNIGASIIVKNFIVNATYFNSIRAIWVIGGFSGIDPNIKNPEHRNESLEFSIGYQLDVNKLRRKKK